MCLPWESSSAVFIGSRLETLAERSSTTSPAAPVDCGAGCLRPLPGIREGRRPELWMPVVELLYRSSCTGTFPRTR
jgi:hypothetical protein